VTNLANEVAAASGEQSRGIELLNSAINQMNQLTQENAASAEEAASASEESSVQAELLENQVKELVTILSGVRTLR
jgi:methyl-accepting chemotaxis protein